MLINEVFPTVKRKGVEGLEKVSISTMVKNDEKSKIRMATPATAQPKYFG